MTDFKSVIEKAQQLPDLPEGLDDDIPDFLKGSPSLLAERVPMAPEVGEPGEGGIPGATKYNLRFHCEKFVVGQVLSGFEHGNPVYEDQDDSKAYIEVMNKVYAGSAILNSKKETFLKDGTVVVWVEWAEYAKPPPKKERSFLTESELRTPDPEGEEEEDEDEATDDFDIE